MMADLRDARRDRPGDVRTFLLRVSDLIFDSDEDALIQLLDKRLVPLKDIERLQLVERHPANLFENVVRWCACEP